MRPWGRQRATNIGPLDKRLRVRRCEQCRIRRTKCEGDRPCQACKSRLTACRGQASQNVTPVGTISSARPAVAAVLAESRFMTAIDHMECLALVHQFVGESPSPITYLFSTAMLLRWFREDKSIRAVLACIGNIYATGGRQSTVSLKGGMLMENEQRELYATIQTRFRKPDSYMDRPLLLLGILFCLLQLMSNRSPNISLQIVDQMTHYIVQPRGPHGFSTPFDKSALLLFRTFEGLGCLMRDCETPFTDEKWCTSIVDVQKSGISTSKMHDMSLFECLCTFVASLAGIKAQSRTWLHQEMEFAGVSGFGGGPMESTSSVDAVVSTYSEHLAAGQRIIQQASELLESIHQFEDIVNNSEEACDSSKDMFLAHSLSLKIATLRQFAHPPWQNAPLSKEVLQQSQILEYAHSALNHVERRMQHAGVEAVVFIDHLLLIGVEMRSSLDRLRVMSLLDAIKSRGFLVAEVYIEDLQLAWKAVPASRSPDVLS